MHQGPQYSRCLMSILWHSKTFKDGQSWSVALFCNYWSYGKSYILGSSGAVAWWLTSLPFNYMVLGSILVGCQDCSHDKTPLTEPRNEFIKHNWFCRILKVEELSSINTGLKKTYFCVCYKLNQTKFLCVFGTKLEVLFIAYNRLFIPDPHKCSVSTPL